MDQDQKFKPAAPRLELDEPAFEFKPLDLSQIGAPPKRTRIVRVPCEFCRQPGCFNEREVPVDE